MSGYIRLDKGTPEDPRMLELGTELSAYLEVRLIERADRDIVERLDALPTFGETDQRDLLCNAMLGGLVRLWTYADTHVMSTNCLPLSTPALAHVMRLPEWTVHLFPADWIELHEEDGYVVLPGYVEKSGIFGHDIRKEGKDLQREKWARQKRNQRKRDKKMSAGHRADMSTKNVHLSTPPPVPVPVPLPLDRNRDRGTGQSQVSSAAAGELASATGRLARRDSQANGNGSERPTKSLAQLEADARMLHRKGLDLATITASMTAYGVTHDQVTGWISNAPTPDTEARHDG